MSRSQDALSFAECMQCLNSQPAPSRMDVNHIMESLVILVQTDENVCRSEIAAAIKAITKVIMHLFDKLEDLEEKLKDDDDILFGQVASKLEKEMVTCILKDTGVSTNGKFITLNQLEIALENSQSRAAKRLFPSNADRMQQFQKANENMTCLEDEIGSDLFTAIESFKKNRNVKAHPDTPLQDVINIWKAKAAILEPWEEEIIGRKMLDTLRDRFKVTSIGTYTN